MLRLVLFGCRPLLGCWLLGLAASLAAQDAQPMRAVPVLLKLPALKERPTFSRGAWAAAQRASQRLDDVDEPGGVSTVRNGNQEYVVCNILFEDATACEQYAAPGTH